MLLVPEVGKTKESVPEDAPNTSKKAEHKIGQSVPVVRSPYFTSLSSSNVCQKRQSSTPDSPSPSKIPDPESSHPTPRKRRIRYRKQERAPIARAAVGIADAVSSGYTSPLASIQRADDVIPKILLIQGKPMSYDLPWMLTVKRKSDTARGRCSSRLAS